MSLQILPSLIIHAHELGQLSSQTTRFGYSSDRSNTNRLLYPLVYTIEWAAERKDN